MCSPPACTADWAVVLDELAFVSRMALCHRCNRESTGETHGGRRAVHLTNDAIQKTMAGYGAFEEANKLSMVQLQAALAGQVRAHLSHKGPSQQGPQSWHRQLKQCQGKLHVCNAGCAA